MMSEITIPRTPTPGSKSISSPPAILSSDLTPPPSTQIPKPVPDVSNENLIDPQVRLVSPPSTQKPTPRSQQDFGHGSIPTLEEARRLPDSQCRDLVMELIPTLGEARMALAHSKLQLNLLTIESAEAAQRAEAEHDLTRREVEVLQASSPTLRNRTALYPDPRSPLAQVQRHLESSIMQGRELEAENYQLQRRLKQAKKVIKHLDSKNSQLVEDNHLLRERIRQNRDHYNEIKAAAFQGSNSISRVSTQSPQRNRATPANSGRSRKQDPLDALLMADQLLSGGSGPVSVPATPTPYRAGRHNIMHTRGTHSLSSLPSTPNRSRPVTADEILRTPINQIVQMPHVAYSAPIAQMQQKLPHPREDRDSTISASDEEAVTDEEIPASQASQAASRMLQRHPGPSSKGSPRMERQERLVQSRLIGKTSKSSAGGDYANFHEKHDIDKEEHNRARKRARLDVGREEIGLGIGWPSPKR